MKYRIPTSEAAAALLLNTFDVVNSEPAGVLEIRINDCLFNPIKVRSFSWLAWEDMTYTLDTMAMCNAVIPRIVALRRVSVKRRKAASR